MANKPLTIEVSSNAVPIGELNGWATLGNIVNFIQSIQTPKIDENTNISQLVSGIPTAFARVDLFKTAIEHLAVNRGESATEGQNLMTYYNQLADEWKGLIACIALDYAHITVKAIELEYSDHKDVSKTANVYEPKGAFGNMLLKRRKLWESQSAMANDANSPYINVIKYHGEVVGATAPEALLFTSTGYSCAYSEDKPWINRKTGKFTDPLRSGMTQDQTVTLYAYIGYIINGLRKLEEYYSTLPKHLQPKYTAIRTYLTNWQKEVERYAEGEGYDVAKGTVPPVDAKFKAPFDELFCHQVLLFGLEGEIYEGMEPNAIQFDPKDILLDEKAQPAQLRLNISSSDLKNLPILVMQADVKGSDEKMYFALPISALGLNVFGKNVASLVNMTASDTAIKSSLRATFDKGQKTENLEVVLTLVTKNGVQRELKKVYTSTNAIEKKDIIIWPNFISQQWDRYYMLNELPHNEKTDTYRAFPFVGKMEGTYFRILVNDSNTPVLLSENGKPVTNQEEVKAELLVKSDEAVADNPYKYEIYESNLPFKGVRLLSPTSQEGGYLLINYSSAPDTLLPRDLMDPQDIKNLEKVRLGVDFGSTNTSIAYYPSDPNEKMQFKNQRVSLMGYELPGKPVIPRANQVLFFQGYGAEIEWNSIKSVLTLHDSRRLPALAQGQTAPMRNKKEVVGGFPSFAENLPFADSDVEQVSLNFPVIGRVRQIHNMKWGEREEDIAHKSAYLRSLMLHVYANLFDKGKVPVSLKWSFPSSMKGKRMQAYQEIWQSLKDIVPVSDPTMQKYELQVSDYIQSLGGSLNQNLSFTQTEKTAAQSASVSDTEESGGFGGGFSGSFGNSGGGFGGGFGSSGGFGGGFGSGGFGNTGAGEFGQGGFDDGPFGGGVQQPVRQETYFEPDDPQRVTEYKPKPLYDNKAAKSPSLSEAEAVANYVSSSPKIGASNDILYLTFDVGGSTTDISALFYLGQQQLTMVKQNSIRFAAQRVSDIVGKFPEFKNVLNEICAQYNIKMVGLNIGEESYNERTASYYFNQIVNRLSPDQLDTLYRKINARCPQLMCVNLYVTGLLMFYAGELANKLVDDLLKTTREEWPSQMRKPKVVVSFAGKGSRLFQWLTVNNPSAANEYYMGMFILGYGQQQLQATLAGWPRINLPTTNDPDIKYEVSKGLAKGDTTLHAPSTNQPSEIIGEEGFSVVGTDHSEKPVAFTNSLNADMIHQIGFNFKHTDQGSPKKFTEFCGYFYSAAHAICGWDINPHILEEACKNLNITGYIQNMPEYRAADNETRTSQKPFDFVIPVIIAEGMKFYENSLLKLL